MQGDTLPEYDRSHYVMTCDTINGSTGEVTERKLIDYQDLCETCTGVVEKAVAKLRQEKAPESSKKKEAPASASRKSLAAAVVKKTKKELSDKKGPCAGCGQFQEDHPNDSGCQEFHTAADKASIKSKDPDPKSTEDDFPF